ncbi:MAG: hypothetical protein ABR511_03830 [Acidimicrobiales bacterium]
MAEDGWDDFEDVERWAAGARAQDAAEGRLRERWLRRQAEEEAAFAGVLVDLAERAAPVVLATTGGRHLVGPVLAVGADFAALRTAGGRTTMVALGAVASVQAARGAAVRDPGRAAADSRHGGPAARRTATVADVLAHAVERRPRVQLRAGAALVVGELRAVGADVVTVHTDGDPPGVAYARLASVSEISLLDSG